MKKSPLPPPRKPAHHLVSAAMPPARIIWLRQRRQLGQNALHLQKTISGQGLLLEIADAFDISFSQLVQADLIFLDAFDRVDGMVEIIVARIRLESRVPLVMLTEGYSTDQLVTALTAGADAIWSINTPIEVLLARCNALLRRCVFVSSKR